MSEGPVFEAARAGESDAVKAAVEADPSLVSAHGKHSVTLLHLAAEHDDAELAAFLVEAGADIEAESSWGHTPFEWGATLGSAAAAAVLLEAGAQRLNLWTGAALGMFDEVESAFDRDGLIEGWGRAPRPGADLTGWPEDVPFRTGDFVSDAFYIACRNGHLDVAKFLLGMGADVDARGYFGAPALHWAAVNGHREVVEWLVGVGADVEIDDPEFDGSPSGWAWEGGHHDLADWLKEVGG